MTQPSTRWVAFAACKGAPQSIFFTDETGPKANDAAKAICHSCDVSADCLAYAKYHRIGFGVWGGRSPRERGVRVSHPKLLECHECGRVFEWTPFPGVPTPKCCSPTCVRNARARTTFKRAG